MNQYTFYMSLRSPFARRSRLLLESLKLSYDEKVLDMFNPPAEYSAINPLLRVPALQINSTKEVIVDSNQIFQYLHAKYPYAEVFQLNGLSLEKAMKFSGLAVGMMELIVARFLTLLNPVALQDQVTIQEAEDGIQRALKFFENEVTSPYFCQKSKDPARFWDYDLVVAIGYMAVRMEPKWLENYPNLRNYMMILSEKPEFTKTAPPK